MVAKSISGVVTTKLTINYIIYLFLLSSPIFANKTNIIANDLKEFLPLETNISTFNLPESKNDVGASILRQHNRDLKTSKKCLHLIPLNGDMAEFSLSENTPVGTKVYRLKANDPKNGSLYYFLTGPYLEVDQQTGIVTLKTKLDREKQESFKIKLAVSATKKPGKNSMTLHRKIYVLDANDNPPVFTKMLYTVNISETTAVNSELKVTPRIVVSDADIGENALINVECAAVSKCDVEVCSTFKIITNMVTRHENQVRIFLASPLNYEARSSYAILLNAKDQSAQPLSARAMVEIYVWKDFVPTFLKTPYNLIVSENTLPNTSVLEIEAKCELGSNARVMQNELVLSLEGDSMRYFQLIPGKTPGKATLATSQISIDRESAAVVNGTFYNLKVKASKLIKNDLPSDFAIEDICVFVADVDDNVPKFNSPVFNYTIKDVTKVEKGDPLPLTIFVEDKDLGNNSRYNLGVRDVGNITIEPYFSVNPESGEGKTYVVVVVEHLRSLIDFGVKFNKLVFDIVAFNDKKILASTRLNINIDGPRRSRSRRLNHVGLDTKYSSLV